MADNVSRINNESRSNRREPYNNLTRGVRNHLARNSHLTGKSETRFINRDRDFIQIVGQHSARIRESMNRERVDC